MPPNRDVIVGRDANLARFQARNWTSVEYAHMPIDVGGAGDVAYVQGTYTVAITLPDVSDPVEDEGKYLAIVLRQTDGEWLIDKMMWSSVRPRS